MAEEGTSNLPPGKRLTRKQQALDWLSRLSDDLENPAKLQDKAAESSEEPQKTLVQNEASGSDFMLYNISDRSIVQKLPMINPVNIQATEECTSKDGLQTGEFPDYKSEKVEAIKNGVWGNTFFMSKRAAKLLGPEMAGKFQYKTSNHVLQSSNNSAKPSKLPKSPIHRRKAPARVMDDEDERIHCTTQ